MNFETRTVCLMLATAALASQLPAQFSQCSPTVPSAPLPILRTEGTTERVPTFSFTCTGGMPTPAGQPVPTATISVQLNVPVTSHFLSVTAGSPLTDVYLFLDNPAPANQNFAPVSSSSNQSFNGTLQGNGTGINFASGSVPNVFLGSIDNVNGVQFNNVLIDPTALGRTFTISNLRVNASSLSLPVPLQEIGVQLLKLASNSGYLALVLQPVNVATVQPGLTTSVTTGSAPNNLPYNAGLLAAPPILPDTPSFVLKFRENISNAFKTKTSGPQDVIGQSYNNTEAGFTNPNYKDTASLADVGTRLKAFLTTIPPGGSIFVPTSLPGGQGAAQANLVSPGTVTGTTGLTKLPVTNGTATAVYEVVDSDPTVIEEADIGVFVAFTTAPAPGTISVSQSFDSVSGGVQFVNPYAGPDPLPPPVVFTIDSSTGAAPELSGAVDSRTCSVGETVSDPQNSCSPGQSPQVSVYSDSSPALPNFSAATTGGVIITATPAGSTPANFSLQVTAPGAAPGTYQQTLQFSAPGAGNTLTLNFPVTVLPANNPIIKPGGITDAFSFQSGTISPGLPFPLFGFNFGGPNLVTGTLDASGKLGTTVSNTQVLFDGTAAPLLYVVNGQLSGIAPFELKGKTSTKVQVVSNGLTSPTQIIPVNTASLSIASADGSGGNGAVIINPDGSVNSPQNPAAGGNVVVIYVAYGGPLANGVTGTDGRTTTAAPYPAPLGPVSVFMGGVQATNILYFGNVPTLLESVMQINVAIPAGVGPAPNIPVQVATADAVSLPLTTIAVK